MHLRRLVFPNPPRFVGYLQVVLLLPLVYGVHLPVEYLRVMNSLQVVNLDWLSLFDTPPECFGSLTRQLAIVAILPLVMIAMLTVLSIAASVWTSYREESTAFDPRGAIVQGALRSLPVTLAVIFAVLPAVSSRIFSVFACDRFATGDAAEPYRSFVHADYRVECALHDPVYRQAVAFALALIVVYPCGMLCFFALLLKYSRRSLRSQKYTAITAATAFLHRECACHRAP